MDPQPFALLACSVFEREVELYAAGMTHLAEIRWYEIALHDRPDRLRAELQGAVDELSARSDVGAVALLYGLCGLGTAGLRAGRVPLVLPRAHDCMTLFLGDRERYAQLQRACPSCFWFSPGWNRARRVPGPDRLETLRAELADRFDPEDAEYLVEMERSAWAQHDTAHFVDLGTADAEAEAAYAEGCARWLGWRFRRLPGDPGLLRDLLAGKWDAERFLVVHPGETIAHSPDDRIVRAEAGDR